MTCMVATPRPDQMGNIKTNGLVNLALERKNELERRKKLRLLQVRQQSKDFAKVLRESVKEEELHQKNAFIDCKKRMKEQQLLEELNKLKSLYQSNLQVVGESHREAKKQPNYNLIKEVELKKGSVQAAIRGVKARRQQQEKKDLQRSKVEAPLKQKKNARNTENVRSAFISSLPKATDEYETYSEFPSKPNHQNIHEIKSKHILENVPTNLVNYSHNQELHSSDTHRLQNNNTQDSQGLQNKTSVLKKNLNINCDPKQKATDFIESPSKECSCDYIVCCCHQTSNILRRRCNSDSVVESDASLPILKSENGKLKTRSRSCSPRSVRTLNYCDTGNLYESNQQSFAVVTQHNNLFESNAEEPNSITGKNLIIENKIKSEELKKNLEIRSSKALQKEELKRNFQKLLQDLKKFSRGKVLAKSKKSIAGVYLKERDVLAKKISNQKKLSAVFETLLHTAKLDKELNTGVVQQVVEVDVDESSVPSLNLATYKQVNMYRDQSPSHPSVTTRIATCEEYTVTQMSNPQEIERHQSPGRTESPGQCQPPRRGHSPAQSQSPGRSLCNSSPPRQRSPIRSKTPLKCYDQTEPTGTMQVSVKPREHKKKCKKSKSKPCSAIDSSTSYLSPPENLTPSQKLLLDAMMIQVNKKALNKDLRKYIKKLLTMSRESIDDLDTSSSIECPDSTLSSPHKQIKDDLIKLGHLTELYADQVNTLVDIFEECSQLQSPEQYFSPPAPTLQGSPGDRNQPCPTGQYISPEQLVPATPDPYYISQQPPSSALPRSRLQPPRQRPQATTPQQANRQLGTKQTPVRKSRAPERMQTPQVTPASARHTKCHHSHDTSFQRIPRKPTTPPMHRTPRRLQSPSPQARCPQKREQRNATSPSSAQRLIPQGRQVGYPPGSAESKIPRLVSPQRTSLPSPKPRTPCAVQTPLGISSNLLPHPRDVFGEQVATQPCPAAQTPRNQLSPIYESPDIPSQPLCPPLPPCSPGANTLSGGDESSFDPFQGLPNSSYLRNQTDPSKPKGDPAFENIDFEAELEQRGLADDFRHIRELLKQQCPPKNTETVKECHTPQDNFGFQSSFGAQDECNFQGGFGAQNNFDFQEGFGTENDFDFQGGFGAQDNFGVQDDFGNQCTDVFGDEEFRDAADIILQTEAPPDDYVEYPEDFPPPTDVFGPGFDWSTANQSNPCWPHSFPGEPLCGHSMSDKDTVALDCIDDSADVEALAQPLNINRINSIRKKLSEICSNQYCEVIQMLQEDYAKDQSRFGSLLKRVASDPFQDPDETLAPIPQVRAKSQSPLRSPADSSWLSLNSSGYRENPNEARIDNLTSLSILAENQEKYDLNEKFCKQ